MSEKSDLLCTALNEMVQQEELNGLCNKIKEIISEFIKSTKDDKNVDLVLADVSPRIKDVESFREKLSRKNYLISWSLESVTSIQEAKQTIRNNLEDLVGVRINCYFKKDELNIYNKLIGFLNDNHIEIHDNGKKNGTIKKQKNGNIIYKIVCKIELDDISYLFEIQIKCLVHSLWGEVEHKTIYKADQYEYDFSTRNQLLKSFFKSLSSSDSQLFELYKRKKYTVNDLIHSLFFLYTTDYVKSQLDGKNPTEGYTHFFELFANKETEITKFVIGALSITNDPKLLLTMGKALFNNIVPTIQTTQFSNFFLGTILDHYLEETVFDDLFAISSVIYKFSNRTAFYIFTCAEIEKILSKKNKPISKRDQSHHDEDNDDDENVEFNQIQAREEKNTTDYTPHIYCQDQEDINSLILKDKVLKRDGTQEHMLKCVEILFEIFIGD